MAILAAGSLPWLLWVLAAAAGLLGFGLRTGHGWLLWLSAPFWALLLGSLWFFRDPDRPIAQQIVCPADGRVTGILDMDDPEVGAATRISIFMSPLDVHVNRYPVAGKVVRLRHRPGKHVPAFRKESDRNERVETILDHGGRTVKLVQIAGAVARRIVPYHEEGHDAVAGQRMGLIRFGSRFDIYVPQGQVQWQVKVGDRVLAGVMTIGVWGAP